MRCEACDNALSDREATRKSKKTGDFLELCDHCYEPIKQDVPTVENPLASENVAETFFDNPLELENEE